MDHIKNSSSLPEMCWQPAFTTQLAHPNMLSRFSPWQLDFRQIDHGKMTTAVTIRPGEFLSVLEIKMSRAVHQVGAAPLGTLNFGLPLQRHSYVWQGTEIRGPSICSFGNGDQFDAECETGFHGVTLSVAQDAVERVADLLQLDIPDTLMRPAAIRGAENSARITRLAKMAQMRLSDQSSFEIADQEFLILELLTLMCMSDNHRDRSSLRSRTRAVRNAIDFMEESADDNLPMSEVCKIVSVSWATLDRAFKERFGIGPKAYFNRLRLNRVRTDILLVADPVPIAEAANRWGFWHMGQFAQDYRRQFGELPSSTKNGRDL